MDQTRVNQVIQFFTDELRQSGIDIYSTILFGSCSTGLSTDQSDIDIAIVSQNFQDYEFPNRFHLIGKQIVKTVQHYHIPVDVIPLTQDEYENEKSIRMELIRRGRLIIPENRA
jgi:predicted nucleotidyltransferase